jgi:hypothetical protein
MANCVSYQHRISADNLTALGKENLYTKQVNEYDFITSVNLKEKF